MGKSNIDKLYIMENEQCLAILKILKLNNITLEKFCKLADFDFYYVNKIFDERIKMRCSKYFISKIIDKVKKMYINKK